MNKKKKQLYPRSSLPRGQKDISGDELRITNLIISKISAVYESYGFEGLSTPAFEFSEALGKSNSSKLGQVANQKRDKSALLTRPTPPS